MMGLDLRSKEDTAKSLDSQSPPVELVTSSTNNNKASDSIVYS